MQLLTIGTPNSLTNPHMLKLQSVVPTTTASIRTPRGMSTTIPRGTVSRCIQKEELAMGAGPLRPAHTRVGQTQGVISTFPQCSTETTTKIPWRVTAPDSIHRISRQGIKRRVYVAIP